MKTGDGAIGLLLTFCVFMQMTTPAAVLQTNGNTHALSKEDGTTAGGFRLSGSVDKQQFVSGEPILLKVSLRNVTNDTLHVLGTIFQLDCEVDVKNERGEGVPLTEAGKRVARGSVIDISLGRIFIEAGKAEQETLHVNRLYDMSVSGKYTIVIRRGVPGRVLHQPVVVSNTVTLRVVGNAEQVIRPERE